MSVRRGVTDCALQLHRLCQVCPLIVLKIVDQNSPIKSVNEKLIVDLLNVQIPTLLYFYFQVGVSTAIVNRIINIKKEN